MIDNDCDCDPDPDSDIDHFHAHGRTADAWVTVSKIAAHPTRSLTLAALNVPTSAQVPQGGMSDCFEQPEHGGRGENVIY